MLVWDISNSLISASLSQIWPTLWYPHHLFYFTTITCLPKCPWAPTRAAGGGGGGGGGRFTPTTPPVTWGAAAVTGGRRGCHLSWLMTDTEPLPASEHLGKQRGRHSSWQQGGERGRTHKEGGGGTQGGRERERERESVVCLFTFESKGDFWKHLGGWAVAHVECINNTFWKQSTCQETGEGSGLTNNINNGCVALKSPVGESLWTKPRLTKLSWSPY